MGISTEVEMVTIEMIFMAVQALITFLLGLLMKNTVIPSKFIPLQNLTIGLISAVIAVTIGLFESMQTAIIICLVLSMAVGGAYDLKKLGGNQNG